MSGAAYDCLGPVERRQIALVAFGAGIAVAGGADIGMLDVEYRPAEIYLARIEIHPDHQGGGIGTRLISALIDEAGQKGQDLVLDRDCRPGALGR